MLKQTMTRYVALSLAPPLRGQDGVRGIAPLNPNIRNDKLRGVKEAGQAHEPALLLL